MHWFLETIRTYPSIPIFFTIGLGFWIGKFKFKSFSLGSVTSVLLVGVCVGQLDIPIGPPLKALFFLIFLFAIGYNCGPQFAAAFRGTGLKQVAFTCVLDGLCLLVTLTCAFFMHYNPGIAAGMFSGSQTISAVLGVATDTIGTLHIPEAQKKEWLDIMPVCYAVCYVYGTVGACWILGTIGPMMLGGLEKVKEETKKLAEKLDHSTLALEPGYIDGNRPIEFRSYKVVADFFRTPQTVAQIEAHFKTLGRRIFVERVRADGKILSPAKDLEIRQGDEIVLSGRHEFMIQDESWIGPEIDDPKLLTFAVEKTQVMVSKKTDGLTIDQLRAKPFMYGVIIGSINRQGGIEIPVLAQTKLAAGDMLSIQGLPQEVDAACKEIGYEQKPTNKTDMVFTALAIALGALVGSITVNFGSVPVTLSTSCGALISGLFFGWLRTKRPSMGIIPQPSIWLMTNLGLNMFIAVIGIQCGPTFVKGIEQVGFLLFVMGLISTSLPLLISVWVAHKIFKFPAPLALGCCAGARTCTASLGAVTAALDSSVPALGYTVTYAIGNTLLILMGAAIVLCLI